MSHTKAPWHTGGSNNSIVYDKNGWAVCNAVTLHSIRSEKEQEANAKLIAAAPELLEALELNDAMLTKGLFNCTGEEIQTADVARKTAITNAKQGE